MKMRLLTAAAFCAAAIFTGAAALHAQGATHSVWDGVYTNAQADRGKDLFADNCARCHGSTLDGDDEYPSLKGSRFMSDWQAQSVADLITRVHTTMPMDNPGTLNQQKSADVVAYLLQQNQIPAGNAELANGTASQIRIDAQKPGN